MQECCSAAALPRGERFYLASFQAPEGLEDESGEEEKERGMSDWQAVVYPAHQQSGSRE